jgi:lysophospholipase L1-like esterase
MEDVKRIMVFGDSNSFHPNGGKTCWPALLVDKASGHFTIFNESCDSRTTKHDIGEFNGLNVIASKLTTHAPLDYLIVMLGTNDVKTKYRPPSATEIAYGLGLIFDVINTQGGGAKAILVTPLPLGNVTSGELASAQWRIPSLVAEYRLLATNRNVPLVGILSWIAIQTSILTKCPSIQRVDRKWLTQFGQAHRAWPNPLGKENFILMPDIVP